VTATRLVVDASVALKWYLVDEPHRERALELFQSWEDSRIELVAPSFFPLEVANGLRRAVMHKKRALAPDQSREHLCAFLAMALL